MQRPFACKSSHGDQPILVTPQRSRANSKRSDAAQPIVETQKHRPVIPALSQQKSPHLLMRALYLCYPAN